MGLRHTEWLGTMVTPGAALSTRGETNQRGGAFYLAHAHYFAIPLFRVPRFKAPHGPIILMCLALSQHHAAQHIMPLLFSCA